VYQLSIWFASVFIYLAYIAWTEHELTSHAGTSVLSVFKYGAFYLSIILSLGAMLMFDLAVQTIKYNFFRTKSDKLRTFLLKTDLVQDNNSFVQSFYESDNLN